ncbi:autotransporter domain-containing protein [Sphingomonas sp. RB56-2]|uniref:Autotransporter domain-containing protein n=1 Tax=Sphingomonas brevis TaxID=2908206 RepID=A0ABT0SC41_9SPHN|nr:autotransporter domain-containing protein [Sphingomonas brevis]MCL6741978.1 autotransporter domain-containing protein [Sphingomonas brevis]
MGTKVRFEDDKSLRGKIGGRVGFPFAAGGGNGGLFYAGGAWVHEFEGDGHIELGDDGAIELRVHQPRDYADFNAGISIEGKGTMSGFLEGTAKVGKDDYGSIGIRGGLRLNF